jgi:uncharacterized protein (TIGR02118 family)
MRDPPRCPAHEHAEHPRFPGRQHGVVEAIADVGRLLGRDAGPAGELLGELPRRRLALGVHRGTEDVSPRSKNTARSDEPPPSFLTARIPPRRCPPIQEAPMVKVHIWLRRKEDTTLEEFAEYWLSTHSAIARDGYENLRGYVVNIVRRVPDGQEAPYDGVAELSWEDRDGFSADMKSDAARRSTEDLKNFTRDVGLLFVEQTVVK